MASKHEHFGRRLSDTGVLRRALTASLVIHIVVIVAVGVVARSPDAPRAPVIYKVEVVPPPQPELPKAPVAEAPEPQPEPEVKSPEPKPEPKPEPEPEPKPEPRPAPKTEPKPPPPKPKPEPPSPKPKKDAKKETPKAEKKPPKPEVEPRKDTKPAISMREELPSVLDYWGRNVKRKVERYWTLPSGIRLDKAENEAVVVFWVDRRGNLTGLPTIAQAASDPALGESGVRAIRLAAPFPPLPDDYRESEVQVSYVFGTR